LKPVYIHESSEDESITINEVFDDLVYEPEWFNFFSDKIKNIVDIGAYIGAFSLWIHEKLIK